MPDNCVLRETFEPKRDEVTREWRILHSEKLHDFCFSSNIIWVIKSIGMTRMGERKGVYRVLVETPEAKSPLESHRSKW